MLVNCYNYLQIFLQMYNISDPYQSIKPKNDYIIKRTYKIVSVGHSFIAPLDV